MSSANNTSARTELSQLVRLPEGVRHHKTTATARSWDAYDALTSTDGWEARSWWVDHRQDQCSADTPGATLHQHKRAIIDGYEVVVFPPHTPREHPVSGSEDEAWRELEARR